MMKRIPLKERLSVLRSRGGPPFGRLCDLNLEDYLQAIELVAGEPRKPIFPEDSKDWLRSHQIDRDETLAIMVLYGEDIEGKTLQAQYLYNLLLYPILILEDYL